MNALPRFDQASPSVGKPPFASAVYEGEVHHHRYLPRPHGFRYRIAQLYLDLGELEQIFARRWLWSVERPNLAQFRRADYMGPADLPLDEAVRRRVEAELGRRPEGPIRLLTHLRYAGYIFNPVSFYYCFTKGGAALDCIIAEITNTPWLERHSYVLPVRQGSGQPTLRFDFAKRFHVSPFMPMDCEYAWRFSEPGQALRVHMRVKRQGQRAFDAAMSLHRLPLTGRSLARVLLRYPLMTAQVIGGIYWQAGRLWLKHTPYHSHPNAARS
jgi:uncharacterized protein